ncbi:hypothetical protein WMY93_016267 [Mugilogobius chulae]|uniref:Uncharacterized protein n=1 Tax=Mugilogobius chulae TaxID=88201 RepID=A0AAW0NT14_9GOBI
MRRSSPHILTSPLAACLSECGPINAFLLLLTHIELRERGIYASIRALIKNKTPVDSSDGTNSSWSSGVTTFLHHSIKKHSQEVFESRIRQSTRSRLEDEVTTNVFNSNSLQAFRKPMSPSSSMATIPEEDEKIRQKSPCSTALRKSPEITIDKNSTSETSDLDEELVIPPPPQFCQGFICAKKKQKGPFLETDEELYSRPPHRSDSLPHGINTVSHQITIKETNHTMR